MNMMENNEIRLRLNEAIAFAQQKRQITKKELAMKIWNGSREQTALTNLANLSSGRSQTIPIESVVLICKELGVTADFLFGLEEEPTRVMELAVKKQNMRDAIALMADGLADFKDGVENF